MSTQVEKDVDLAELNTIIAPYLLIFTWKVLKIVNAKSVKITALNNNAIGVSAVVMKPFSSPKNVDQVYNFTSAEKERFPDLTERVKHVVKQDTGTIFPFQGVHVINLWIVAIISALPNDKLIAALLMVKPYLLYVFRSEEIARYVLLAVLGIHAIETLVIWYLISPVVKKGSALASWLFYGLLIGFPITERALTISSLHGEAQELTKSK